MAHLYLINFVVSGPEMSLVAARVAASKLTLAPDPNLEGGASHTTLDVLPDHAHRLELGRMPIDRAFLIGMASVIRLIDPEGDDDRLGPLAVAMTPRRDELRRLRARPTPPTLGKDDADPPF